MEQILEGNSEIGENTGAQEGSSPESTPASEESNVVQGTETASTNKQDFGSFDKHPRFIELIEQKNQAREAQKQLEEKYAALEARLQEMSSPKEPKPRDELLADLDKIDPRLSKFLENLQSSTSELGQLRERLAQYEREQLRNQAYAQVNSLHESNKAPEAIRGLINQELELLDMQGKIKGLNDLPNVYKATLAKYNKLIDDVKRSERESYVAAKKTDAKVPTSQPKGAPAKAAPTKEKYSKDKEEAKQQIVAKFLQNRAAERDASSV